MSQGTGSCIRMYINAVANRVILHLRHDFYNTIFKIKQAIYTCNVIHVRALYNTKNSKQPQMHKEFFRHLTVDCALRRSRSAQSTAHSRSTV
jgi:hypothetical protein